MTTLLKDAFAFVQGILSDAPFHPSTNVSTLSSMIATCAFVIPKKNRSPARSSGVHENSTPFFMFKYLKRHMCLNKNVFFSINSTDETFFSYHNSFSVLIYI